MTDPTPQHITLTEVKAACRKAYDEKRLLAQNPNEGYAYRVGDFRCAIGAALNNDALDIIDKNTLGDTVLLGNEAELAVAFTVDSDELVPLSAIQDAHDAWMSSAKDSKGNTDIRQGKFLTLISQQD